MNDTSGSNSCNVEKNRQNENLLNKIEVDMMCRNYSIVLYLFTPIGWYTNIRQSIAHRMK